MNVARLASFKMITSALLLVLSSGLMAAPSLLSSDLRSVRFACFDTLGEVMRWDANDDTVELIFVMKKVKGSAIAQSLEIENAGDFDSYEFELSVPKSACVWKVIPDVSLRCSLTDRAASLRFTGRQKSSDLSMPFFDEITVAYLDLKTELTTANDSRYYRTIAELTTSDDLDVTIASQYFHADEWQSEGRIQTPQCSAE